MLDLTTIILTFNEELHIRRALENVSCISKHIIVVDCNSTDKTCEICSEFDNVEVVQHAWPGNQAAQFNWTIDHNKIDTEWILRIDADEYLLPELLEELEHDIPTLPKDITGIEFKRRHIFMGKWVKRGIYPVVMMRMFRTGVGRYDERLMDEHIVLSEGRSMVMKNDFCDHSLISISEYCIKHVNYAYREATEVLAEVYELQEKSTSVGSHGKQAESKHKKKNKYNRFPVFWRSFAYFCYRYFFRFGFLDGKEGFLFAYIQGWWYRTLVDAKILEVRKAVFGSSKKPKAKNVTIEHKQMIKDYIARNWGIKIS